MKKMARPPKYNPQTVQIILDAIRDCMTYASAAEAGGISYDTFNEWRKHHAEFSEAVLKANADAKLALLRQVKAATKRDWRSAAWMLEHRFPDEFGGKDNVNLNIDLTDPNIPIEVLERLAKGESIFTIIASISKSPSGN